MVIFIYLRLGFGLGFAYYVNIKQLPLCNITVTHKQSATQSSTKYNGASQELSCDYLYALRASKILEVNDVHLVYDGALRSSFAVGFGLRAIVDH